MIRDTFKLDVSIIIASWVKSPYPSEGEYVRFSYIDCANEKMNRDQIVHYAVMNKGDSLDIKKKAFRNWKHSDPSYRKMCSLYTVDLYPDLEQLYSLEVNKRTTIHTDYEHALIDNKDAYVQFDMYTRPKSFKGQHEEFEIVRDALLIDIEDSGWPWEVLW